MTTSLFALRFAKLTLLLSLALPAGAALAQQAPPPPPNTPNPPRQHGGPEGGERPAPGGASAMLGLPPGIWWNDPAIVSQLTLTADQQHRMDEIFRRNRVQLVDLRASLEKEQINLEPLLNAPTLDQGKTMASIEKIADLRAGLEKADARMLLELRGVLTADQWTKLHAMDRHHRGGPANGQPGGRRGAGQPGGPPPTPEDQDDAQ